MVRAELLKGEYWHLARAVLLCWVAFSFLLVPCLNGGPALAQATVTGTASVTGSVTDAAGRPVTGATVDLVGPQTLRSTTDTQGRFLFSNVPLGLYRISVSASGLGTASRGISVERDIIVAIQYESLPLKVIARTSTQAQARFNVTPASVTPLNPASAAFQGQTTWRQILEQIPGVSVLGASGGTAFNATIPDSPLSPAIVSVNGAAGYETATIFDGMPLIGTSYSLAYAGSGTDLSFYPMNSFSSVEIIRGPGASSPSIVDSIGGSVVLAPPGLVTRDSGELAFSTDPYGGVNGNATAAFHFGRLSITATYGVNDSPGPVNEAVFPPYPFIPLTVNGRPFSCTGLCAPSYPVTESGYTYGFPYKIETGLLTCCVQASTAWSQRGGSAALRYDVSSRVIAEVFYAGQKTAAFEGAPLFPSDFTPPAGYTGSVPGGDSLRYDYETFTPVPFVQSSGLLEEKISVGFGRGILRLAALQNKTYITETFDQPGPAQPYTTQLYGSGTVGGVNTIFNGGAYTVTEDAFHYLEHNLANNRDMSAAYDTQLSSNLTLGASYVRSYYDIPEVISYLYTEEAYGIPGAQKFLLDVPPSLSETTGEARLHLNYSPSDTTSLDLSYYDVSALYHVANPSITNQYVNQALSYAAPRLGFVWTPNYKIAIRAAMGGGLALAPLNYLVGTNGIPYLNYTGNTPTSYSVQITNLALRPETSFGFDVGTDYRLSPETILSFDAYRDNVYGQLFESNQLTTLNYNGTGLPLFTAEYGNLGVSRYEGLLLSVRRDVARGYYGAVTLGFTRGFVVSVPNGFYNEAGCTNCVNLWVVPGINFNGGLFGGYSGTVPYSQAAITVGYRWSPQTFAEIDPTYLGPNNSYYRPAFVEVDGRLSYGLNAHVSLLLTARNITGVYDGSVDSNANSNLWGVPTLHGPAEPDYGEEYGPRAIILTSQIHF